jgi:hypothetical protein
MNDTADDIGPKNPFEGITDCMIHNGVYDDDCEFCVAEGTAKQAILNDRITDINQRITQIARDGGGAPDPSIIATIKLDTLLDVLLNGRNRLHYEMEVSVRIEQMVAAAALQLTRVKLTQGIPNGAPVGPGQMPVINMPPGFPKKKR